MLIPELELQALRFFNRTELEGLQIHSRYLRDLVERNTQSLALRYIHEVRVCFASTCPLLSRLQREAGNTLFI